VGLHNQYRNVGKPESRPVEIKSSLCHSLVEMPVNCDFRIIFFNKTTQKYATEIIHECYYTDYYTRKLSR